MKLAELTDSVRAILELHMRALDLSDPASAKELEVYRKLANEHRDAAAQLHAIGTEMARYRDLPMGRHDLAALATPANADAFEAFVNIEREVVALLENRLAQDAQMLAALRDGDA